MDSRKTIEEYLQVVAIIKNIHTNIVLNINCNSWACFFPMEMTFQSLTSNTYFRQMRRNFKKQKDIFIQHRIIYNNLFQVFTHKLWFWRVKVIFTVHFFKNFKFLSESSNSNADSEELEGNLRETGNMVFAGDRWNQ